MKQQAKINLKSLNLKSVIIFVATLILGLVAGSTIHLFGTPEGEVSVETEYSIELSDEQKPAEIENADGEVETINVPTIESIDGPQIADECPEGEECGRGWWVDTSSPEAFKNAILGQCVDTDGHFGSQCWDTANLFWQNVAGRNLSTCGTGAAKGTLNCYEQNAGDEFEMVWDANSLQAGDIVVFTNGLYGHIGMAMGKAKDGYIALLGTNQGGNKCSGGGSTANIVNISLKNFGGAFRPKIYIKKETEELPISNCIKWHVARGDTMSKIMLECENTVVYGEAMNAYAKSWYSLLVKPGQSVYDGWKSKSGVGLYAGDEIEHRMSR